MTKQEVDALSEFNIAVAKLSSVLGDPTAIGIILVFGIGKVVSIGGTIIDVHKIVDTTFEALKKARANEQG